MDLIVAGEENGGENGEMISEMTSSKLAGVRYIHAISMAVDDTIECEFGVTKAKDTQCETEVGFNAYAKVEMHGAGIGEVIKAGLIYQMAQFTNLCEGFD